MLLHRFPYRTFVQGEGAEEIEVDAEVLKEALIGNLSITSTGPSIKACLWMMLMLMCHPCIEPSKMLRLQEG